VREHLVEDYRSRWPVRLMVRIPGVNPGGYDGWHGRPGSPAATPTVAGPALPIDTPAARSAAAPSPEPAARPDRALLASKRSGAGARAPGPKALSVTGEGTSPRRSPGDPCHRRRELRGLRASAALGEGLQGHDESLKQSEAWAIPGRKLAFLSGRSPIVCKSSAGCARSPPASLTAGAAVWDRLSMRRLCSSLLVVASPREYLACPTPLRLVRGRLEPRNRGASPPGQGTSDGVNPKTSSSARRRSIAARAWRS